MATITLSRHAPPRHLKMLFWGETGTRKTESILRHFPDVLLIDTEGNAEQCTTMPEIPEFLLAQTKDVNEVIQIVDEVAAGRHTFPDGRPVQTLAIDSISVLWAIRKDVRALAAEQRQARYGKTAEDATLTQLDWSLAKRPLLRLNTRLANCPIRHVIYTARLQDRYQEDARQRDRLVRAGEGPEAVRGLEYEMNLVLRLRFGAEGAWECQVTKVQGALGQALPAGTVWRTFPAAAILRHTSGLHTAPGQEQDGVQLAAAALRQEAPLPAGPEDLPAFYAAAQALGYHTPAGDIDRPRIQAVLRAHGFQAFNPARAGHMLAVLRQALEDGT